MTSSEECSNVVVRLGAFHPEMSYIRSIGRIMSGSGLREILNLLYAPNAVSHVLSGKAISRAVRTMMLLDTAMQCTLNECILDINQFKVTLRRQIPFWTKQISYTVACV